MSASPRAHRIADARLADCLAFHRFAATPYRNWNSISHQYTTASEIEEARLELAQSVLAVAPFHSDDIKALKRNALANMTMKYQASRGSSEPKPS